MITLLVIILLVFFLVTLSKKYRIKNERVDTPPTKYHYERRQYLMTQRERQFYAVLRETIDSEYFIFPQIHLSSILNHKVQNGQNWKAALSTIQRKSVDYVVCDRAFHPLVAIELDDASHKQADRKNRDELVNYVLNNAHMPLVRFKQDEILTKNSIRTALSQHLSISPYATHNEHTEA